LFCGIVAGILKVGWQVMEEQLSSAKAWKQKKVIKVEEDLAVRPRLVTIANATVANGTHEESGFGGGDGSGSGSGGLN
jgi:Holliday junction resolvasome RuvABC endonuclease subunit